MYAIRSYYVTVDQVALLHELIQTRTVLSLEGVNVSLAHASAEHFVGDLAVLAHKLKDMENLGALIVAVRMGDRIRITSYNVCYTKLLRGRNGVHGGR